LPDMDFGLEKKGLLMLCKTPHALAEEARTAELARALGLEADVLDPGAAAALDPGARMDIAGAVYYRADAHVVPDRFMAGMQRQVEGAGAQIFWGAEVTGWRVEDARRIGAARTREGREFEADEFVLCGGSWSPLLTRELGLSIPIEAGKGYSLTLTAPRQAPRIPAILTEARIAVTPMGGALRFAGTMEIAGLTEHVNPTRVRGIIDAVPRYYPQFGAADFAGIEPWCGLRPCSPDGLPYVGRTAKFANLSIAAGHAMMGLNLGPITGLSIAEVLAGEPPRIDLTQLSPDRYRSF
jgi:D-amino-acid dehydrogenase